MKRKPDFAVETAPGTPRLNVRRGVLLLVLIFISSICALSAAPAYDRIVYFSLDKSLIGENGLPDEEWRKQIFPQRDDAIELSAIQPLRLPSGTRAQERFRTIFTLEAAMNTDPSELARVLGRAEGVEWAETAVVRKTCTLPDRDAPPNDPFYSMQWSLEKIFAPAAWDVSRGDSTVVIAIVDIGTDIRHGDLIQKVWTNRAEANGQPGVDDDANGYIDDVNGWDFVDDDSDPRPREFDNHGTHVAGIACAGTDNGFGIAGIGWKCRLMPIRAGLGSSITHGFEGLIYAVDNGADIVNLSWGGEQISQIERVAVEYAAEQGCLIVAAAGNLGGFQSFDHYPAAYESVLAVASTDDHDLRSDFSNTGQWVDVSAPGSRILSLFPNQRYGIESGTSMASPLVAGAAGLLKSLHPDWTPARLKKQLETTCDPIDELNLAYSGKLGSGRINLYRALSEVRAGIVLNGAYFLDEATDGVLDPSDRIQVYFNLHNALSDTAKFSMRMSSQSPLIIISDITVNDLVLPPDVSELTNMTPLRARIAANTADNVTIKCNLELTIEGEGVVNYPFELTVRQSFATIRNDRIALTVSDMGSLGYYDYPKDIGYGEGFRYPADGLSALFHGSLLVGASGNRVSDNAYGNDLQNRHDFETIDAGVRLSYADSSSALTSYFSDRDADERLGLEIWQTTRLMQMTANNNYALLEYVLTLQPGYAALDSVYVGLYLDWDVGRADENILQWDSEAGLGWMNSSGHVDPDEIRLFGAGMVGTNPTFSAAINRTDVNESWTDADKIEIFKGGFGGAVGLIADDWAQIIGAGPFNLEEAETLRVEFALTGGESLSQLRAALSDARRRFGGGFVTAENLPPEKSGLISIYPVPFNSQTTIICKLGRGSDYQWTLYDVTGRKAMQGSGTALTGSVFPISVDLHDLASGSYSFQLMTEEGTFIRPIVLEK